MNMQISKTPIGRHDALLQFSGNGNVRVLVARFYVRSITKQRLLASPVQAEATECGTES